ncbi:MAG: Ig-like domain-containing protein, partial [Anaerolineae bacterium]
MPAKYIAIVVSVSLLMGASGCRDRETEPSATPPASEAEGAGDASLVSSGRPLFGPAPDAGITFRLSDAEPGAPAADRIPVTDPVPLLPERVDELLALLPPMPETASEQVTFALRPGPEPPVLTGDEIQAPFPQLDEAGPPPEVPVGALEVLRYQPEGDIALASHLSVTFSEPMVPLTSHAALADRDVPVRLEPEPAGEWRWVGSRTLVFEPEPRFPMATEYSVEVPAGTAAESGSSLAEAVTWSFRTPPPSLVSRHPVGGPTDRRPVVLLAFDQAIEAEAVLGHTSMTADGAVVELRLASAEEVAADTEAAAMARRMQHEDRWLALRPATDLPMGATAEVVIGAGLPSAEGPRVTEEPDSFEFQVYGPLKADGVRCEGESRAWEWSSASQAKIGCLPLAPLGIKFTNDLDTDAFDPTAVEVEPEIPGAQLIAAGNTITIAGATRGRTRYTVRLPEGLLDVYGNTLTGTKTVVFETGDARATLVAPGGDMIVLDPGGPATLDLMSINNDQLDVRLYKVVPDDWPAYLTYVQQGGFPGEQGGQKAQPPGELAWSGSVPVSGERDALAVAPIDLTPALSGSVGQVVAIVEPAGWSSRDDNWSNRPVRRWVQATQLGLDVFADSSDVLVWVTRLADGEPVQGATARLAPGTETAGTAEDGTAVLRPLAERNQSWPSPVRVEARLGDDVTFLPEGVSPSPWSDYYGGGGWSGSEPGERLTWYVFDDRGLYKPGEVAQVKGWIRRDSSGKGGDVKPLGTPVDVEYRFVARNGREITTGAVTTDEWGGFHLALDVPTDVELGVASVELVARVAGMPEGWGNHWYGLQIGEYRRPEFEVSTTAEAPSYLIDQQGVAVVTAEYYAGGVLPGAETTWDVTAVATTYSPPGHDDFVFGDWRPWWRWDPWYGGGEQAYQAHQGVTDATGKHRLGVDIDSVEPLSPVTVDAQATVMDVNRQAWTSAAALLFHPAEVYVGLRPDRWFKEAGEEFTLDIIAADIEGELVPGLALNVAAARLGWEYKGGDYSETFEPAGSCEVVSGDEPVACRLSFDAGGEYRIVAEVIDVAGRPNLTQLSLWVPGGQTAPSRGLESEQVTLVPGSRYYQPGDKAEILVQSPFAPAEGLLTVRRSGVVHHETFTMDEPTIRLYVPIEDGYQPNITVQVDL